MILVIMGVSGSGKSTVGSFLSKKLGWPLHEGDDYHSKENVEKMASGVPLTDQDRTPWLLCLHDIIQREMCAGTNAILTCSALKKLYRQLLLFGSRALNPSSASHSPDSVGGVLFAFLQGSYELIHARMVARRGHFMAASLLQSQFEMLEPPSESENALTVDIQKSVPEIAAEIERAVCTQQ
ncbi:probable gluconokinase [Megalops cyprinoides]|uniref:probable gluconokinase n=1 Tax=Megalops cyprinoides TaxID=118141 RepID=UPI001864B3D4|nr:probable gluconokinase [Megalops cyprinoides]